MRVQKGPYKLPADIFQAKFKMRMLVDGVVSAVKSTRANIQALLIGDFFGANQL